MKIIGERLRWLRESMHLSQAKVAEHIGISQASVNRYENDLSVPSPETLLWYADFFDVSLDYVFGRTDKPQGVQYGFAPTAIKEKVKSKEDWEQFVEMCFDPNSPMSAKLKETLLNMLGRDNE